MIRRISINLVIAIVILFAMIMMGCSQISNAVSSISLSKKKAPAHSQDERMNWFRDSRFGMFIHWGIYSVPAGIYKGEQVPGIGEWIMEKAKIPVADYDQFAAQFNRTK